MIVIDANVLLASMLPEEKLQAQAREAMLYWADAGTRLAAPRFLRDEVVAVIRKAVFQHRIEHEYGKSLIQRLFRTKIDFYEDDELLLGAYEIATRFNLPRTYDAEYLALAERLDCEFWTADQVLVNSTQSKFRHIRWLGSYNSDN